MRSGTLFLIPTGLGPDTSPASFSKDFLETIHGLTCFIVEHPKTARRFLKNMDYPLPLNQIHMDVLNEHTCKEETQALLKPLLAGTNIGLMSEAGYPCVADPGACFVRLAHEHRIKIKPLIGPSAILLALAASGLNGQRFNFVGYLPVARDARTAKLCVLEKKSQQRDMTQIFIETPYRSQVLFENILSVCRPDTHLCIAADVTCHDESIITQTIDQWCSAPARINDIPTVFLLHASRAQPRKKSTS